MFFIFSRHFLTILFASRDAVLSWVNIFAAEVPCTTLTLGAPSVCPTFLFGRGYDSSLARCISTSPRSCQSWWES
jgi:hypothetical protein